MTANDTSVSDIVEFLERLAPLELAEEWDNVGLLVGRRDATVRRLMTGLTIAPNLIDEAIDKNVDIVVTHHPLPFRSLTKITDDSTTGQMLLSLIKSGIAVYSAHTAFDSCAGGINAMFAKRLELDTVQPLIPAKPSPGARGTSDEGANCQHVGAGRIGRLPVPMAAKDLITMIRRQLGIDSLRFVGDLDKMVSNVSVACGSGGSLLDAAIAHQTDVFVTGEANFHTCLECRAQSVDLILVGHYHSERFAMEELSWKINEAFPSVESFCSESETDPIQTI